jgi:hypothetical protein
MIFNAFLQDTSLLLLVTRDIALLSLQQDGKFISQNLLRGKRMGVIKHVYLMEETPKRVWDAQEHWTPHWHAPELWWRGPSFS